MNYQELLKAYNALKTENIFGTTLIDKDIMRDHTSYQCSFTKELANEKK